MIKTSGADGKAQVRFVLDARGNALSAAVCGEWNGWSPDAAVMDRDARGEFSLTIELEAGRTYRFRYLLDGERWENDWDADAYLPNAFGDEDSLVDLTTLGAASAAKREKRAGSTKVAAPKARQATKKTLPTGTSKTAKPSNASVSKTSKKNV